MPRASHPPHPSPTTSSTARWLSPQTLLQPPTWTDIVSLRVQRDTLTDPITFVWVRVSADGLVSSIPSDQWPLLLRCTTNADGQARLHITTQAVLENGNDPDQSEPPLLFKTLPYNALEVLAFGRFEALSACQSCGNPPARLDGGIGVVDIRENKAIFNWNLETGWVVIAPTTDDTTVYYADAQLLTDCTKTC